MRNKFQMFVYIIVLIFGKSNAFVVVDYIGAVAKENYSSFSTHLSELKKHAVTIEIIFSSGEIEFVNGYAEGNSLFFLNTFLKYEFIYDPTFINQVIYVLDDKKIIMDNILILKSVNKWNIIGITGDTDEFGKDSLSQFTPYFLSRDATKGSLFKNSLITGYLKEVNSFFINNHLGKWVDYYEDSKLNIKIKVYSNKIIEDSWFIIGKPNGKDVDEVIPLNYINKDFLLISHKLNDVTQSTFLMPVNGLKFSQSDIGAYLVKCKYVSEVVFPCKFFGQMTKVVNIDKEKQMVIWSLIHTQLLFENKFLFKSRIMHTLASIDPNRDQGVVIEPKGTEGETFLSQGDSLVGVDKIHQTIPRSPHKDEHTLDHELPSTSKKQKLNSFDKTHLALFGNTCENINILGLHYLNEDVIIFVNKIEDKVSMDWLFGVYNIEGIYKKNDEETEFTQCYISDEGDYLI